MWSLTAASVRANLPGTSFKVRTNFAIGACIVATSFGRTFYRMAVDLGLPIIECADAVSNAKQGDRGRVDTATGDLLLGDKRVRTSPLPQFVQDIIDVGGITNWVKREAHRRGVEMVA